VILSFLAGIAFIDTFGYAYHRWVEHGELKARFPRSRFLSTIARRHAIHHLELYPPSDLRPARDGYHTEDKLSWYVPGALVTVAVLALLPSAFALPFALGGWSYGLAIDGIHRLFHRPRHALERNSFFLLLRRMHDAHHVDQRANFTILCPLWDLAAGTFRER
jgi:sterol desaturase/sphingolipid hydroxylase (fatty acid hydroxylase superfamily)